MDIAEKLANNVLKTTYDDLSPEQIGATKLIMVDSIGCMIGGARAPGCEALREVVLDWGGKAESSILVTAGRVPGPNAALVNGTMARALDFDSVWFRGLHMGAAAVPTALAVAEMVGLSDGREFVTSLMAGEDLAARIHLATPDYDGFEPTGVCGILGLTAIAGRMLSLNESQLIDALGIAFNRAAGSFQPNIDGALVVRVMEGQAARSAIESAILAKKGITGGKNFLEGAYGYFHLFSKGKYDRQALADHLDEDLFESRDLFVKKYPAGGITASAIDATLQLVDEHDLQPEDVEEVTVRCNRFCHNIGGQPFSVRNDPQVDAQFSYPYTVATALVRRRFSLEDITPEAVADPAVLEVAGKVRVEIDDRSRAVTIRTVKGVEHSKEVTHPKGGVENPMSREEILEKFRACVDFAGIDALKENGEMIIECLEELETSGHLDELIRLLTPTS